MEVLFSFGTSEQFPFQGGYIIINAPNKIAAVEEFRRLYPDVHPGILNCSDVYTNPNLIKNFKESGNLGAGCHLYIPLNLPEYCYTVIKSTGEFAMLHKGRKGYSPIDLSLAENPNIRDLADVLNRQFGVSKAQEAAMVAGSMYGWDSPLVDPNKYDENGIPKKPKSRQKQTPAYKGNVCYESIIY